MLYLDTSSLLKIYFSEPESEAVDAALYLEPTIVITPLTELEAMVQLRARQMSGMLTTAKYQRIKESIEALKDTLPFVFRSLAGAIFATALRQHQKAKDIHCRTLDRLHLAAMEELDIKRLMTHDQRQAEVARRLGLEVITA